MTCTLPSHSVLTSTRTVVDDDHLADAAMSTIHSLALHRLLGYYPDIDPVYLSEAVASYDTAKLHIRALPITETVVYVDDLITVFRRKVDDMGGVYPTVVSSSRIDSDRKRKRIADDDRVRTVNRDLMAVSDAFPFVPQHALLELVLHPPPEKPMGHSVLYKLPELLLGRPRVYTPTTVPEPQPTPKAHLLRTESYKQHVQALLLQTFPMLSKSQIRAVGLEVNWEYRAANEACGEIVRRLGWAGRMFGGLRALARPKTRVELEGCPELIEELWEAEKAVRDEAERSDTEAAIEYNRQQYQLEGQTIECVCCFDDVAFEDGAACSSGCFVCHACINAQVSSLLPTIPTPDDSIHPASTLVPCPAAIPPCPGSFIPEAALKAHLAAATFSLYRQSFIKAHIRPFADKHTSELSQCPSCPYFELRPLPRLSPTWQWLLLVVLYVFSFFFHLNPTSHLTSLLRRLEISRSTSLLRCPGCKTTSCRLCFEPVYGIHRCGQAEEPADEAQSLRIAVEQAMADSLKRICPHCEVAFIKADGCNHMRCPCGGHMCYVCRADIKKDGYKHFCPHFRENPGAPCPIRCGRCELYRTESDDIAARSAARKARDEWYGRKETKEPSFSEVILHSVDEGLLMILDGATL